MKPINRFHLLAVFTMLAMTLVSCKKVVDKLYKDPLATLDECYINQITVPDDWLGQRTFIFTYNKKGNPVSVLNNDPTYDKPNYYLKYDKHHRLTDLIGLYGPYENNTLYESWNRYAYDSDIRIVKDTLYIWGNFGPAPDPASYFIYLRTYTYDTYNRIIGSEVIILQETINELFRKPNILPNTSIYNSDGNLNGYIYDDKVNLNRTNKIWMFINKDYSLNNRIGATNYNNYMLPLGFGNGSSSSFFRFELRNSVIDYICKDDDKK